MRVELSCKHYLKQPDFRTTLPRKFHRAPNQPPVPRMSYTPLAGAPVAQAPEPEGRYHKLRSQSYKMASELSPEPSPSSSVTDQIDRHLQVLTRKKKEWAQLPLHRKIEFLLVSSQSAHTCLFLVSFVCDCARCFLPVCSPSALPQCIITFGMQGNMRTSFFSPVQSDRHSCTHRHCNLQCKTHPAEQGRYG